MINSNILSIYTSMGSLYFWIIVIAISAWLGIYVL